MLQRKTHEKISESFLSPLKKNPIKSMDPTFGTTLKHPEIPLRCRRLIEPLKDPSWERHTVWLWASQRSQSPAWVAAFTYPERGCGQDPMQNWACQRCWKQELSTLRGSPSPAQCPALPSRTIASSQIPASSSCPKVTASASTPHRQSLCIP